MQCSDSFQLSTQYLNRQYWSISTSDSEYKINFYPNMGGNPCYGRAQSPSQSLSVLELLSGEQAWPSGPPVLRSVGPLHYSSLLSASNASTTHDLWLWVVCLHSRSAFIVNIFRMFTVLLPGCSVCLIWGFGEFENYTATAIFPESEILFNS